MLINYPFASLIQHVKDLIEPVIIPVGVRDISVAAGVHVVEDHFYLAFLLAGIGEAKDVVVVGAVHSQDEVEGFEVLRLKLAGALPGDVQAVFSGGAYRAGIGWFANVPETGACGIHCPVEAPFPELVLQNTFCEWRPTDIAQANH